MMLTIKCLLTRLGQRALLAFGACALLAVLFVGAQTATASAASWSFVRIFHASPEAGTVDVFMDGTKILSNFQYGTLTGYTPVAAGSHKIQIAVIGTGPDAAILSQSISLRAGTPYTVVALGTRATVFSLRVFADDNRVAGNLAKVRVYHLSPGTGAVDVNKGGSTLISGLPYAQASNYVSISPGSYTFDFNVTPGQNGSPMPVSARLKPWTVTSIFAISPANRASSGEKLLFIQAQVAGVPGMPGTGSDPYAAAPAPASSPSPVFWPWMLLVLALMAASAWVIIVSRRARGKLFGRMR